jgi:hypothetical protein
MDVTDEELTGLENWVDNKHDEDEMGGAETGGEEDDVEEAKGRQDYACDEYICGLQVHFRDHY